MIVVEISWSIPPSHLSCCLMPSSPRWADFFFLHWPDPERWSPYASRSSWWTENAYSAAALSHMHLTNSSAYLATAGPLCYHHLCCILFSQRVIFPLQLGKDRNRGQKNAFSRFCLGIFVYIQDFLPQGLLGAALTQLGWHQSPYRQRGSGGDRQTDKNTLHQFF